MENTSKTLKVELVGFKEDLEKRKNLGVTECFFNASGASMRSKVHVWYSPESFLIEIFEENSAVRKDKNFHLETNNLLLNLVIEHSGFYWALGHGKFLPTLKSFSIASWWVIIDSENNLLLTQRTSKLSFPGSWVFPGGRVDPGENFTKAAIREIQEEVGIELFEEGNSNKVIPFYIYEHVPTVQHEGENKARAHTFIMFYYAKLNQKASDVKITIQDNEVEKTEWVHLNTLKEIVIDEISEESWIEKYGESLNSNFRGMYPNKGGLGIAGAHFRAFKALYLLKTSPSQ